MNRSVVRPVNGLPRGNGAHRPTRRTPATLPGGVNAAGSRPDPDSATTSNRTSGSPTMTQSAQELGRQQRWAEAVADGRVRAWLENGQVTVAVDMT